MCSSDLNEPGVALDPGGSAELKITLRRLEGFRGKLTASCVGLPECLTAVPVTADDKQKEITLVVKAPSDAEPFNGPVDVRIREEEGGREWTVAHELVSTTLNNGVPQGFRDLLIRSSPVIWLTVRPLAEPPRRGVAVEPQHQAGALRARLREIGHMTAVQDVEDPVGEDHQIGRAHV